MTVTILNTFNILSKVEFELFSIPVISLSIELMVYL